MKASHPGHTALQYFYQLFILSFSYFHSYSGVVHYINIFVYDNYILKIKWACSKMCDI